MWVIFTETRCKKKVEAKRQEAKKEVEKEVTNLQKKVNALLTKVEAQEQQRQKDEK